MQALYHCCVFSPQAHNPGWQEVVWDEAAVLRLIQDDFPWFLPTYLSYPRLVQRSDAMRYMALYKYGGVYLDADVSVAAQQLIPAFASACRWAGTTGCVTPQQGRSCACLMQQSHNCCCFQRCFHSTVHLALAGRPHPLTVLRGTLPWRAGGVLHQHGAIPAWPGPRAEL